MKQYLRIMRDPSFGMMLGQAAGGQAAAQAGGGIMDIALGGIKNKQQRRQARLLQDIQIKGNKEMMDYSMGKQLQMWKDTNYGAQMEELKKAGLNAGLLYGMSGGGGVTTGSPSGGVQGQSANVAMGIDRGNLAMTVEQMKLMQAQKANVDAQTAKTIAEKNKLEGIDTTEAETRVKSLIAGIKNTEAQTKLTDINSKLGELATKFESETLENRISKVNLELSGLIEQVKMMENQREISDKTKDAVIEGMKLDVGLKQIEIEAKKSGIAMNAAQIAKWAEEINQEWSKVDMEHRKTLVQEKLAGITGTKLELDKFNTFFNAINQIFNKIMPSASSVINTLKPAL